MSQRATNAIVSLVEYFTVEERAAQERAAQLEAALKARVVPAVPNEVRILRLAVASFFDLAPDVNVTGSQAAVELYARMTGDLKKALEALDDRLAELEPQQHAPR